MPRTRTCREKDRVGFYQFLQMNSSHTLQVISFLFPSGSFSCSHIPPESPDRQDTGASGLFVCVRWKSSSHLAVTNIDLPRESRERFGVQVDKIGYTQAGWTLKGFCWTVMRAIKGSWATWGWEYVRNLFRGFKSFCTEETRRAEFLLNASFIKLAKQLNRWDLKSGNAQKLISEAFLNLVF